MTEQKPFLAVIADTDGVLTSTAVVHRQAWQRMFDTFLGDYPAQASFSDSDYLTYLDGKPRYTGVSDFLSSRNIELPFGEPDDSPEKETICGLGNRKNVLFLQLVEKAGVQVLDGVRSALMRWRRGGLKLGVISASRNCRAILEAAKLTQCVDVIVDGEHALELGLKDKRAIMLQAAKQLDVEPERAVVLEDATAGIRAAREGGFGLAVGISRGNTARDLTDAGASVVASSLSHVRFVRQLPQALNSWHEVTELRQKRALAVFLDFDGTLAPIVDDPSQAGMSPEMRMAVEQLSQSCPVAIVSGRDRADVEERVNIDGLVYAGNHGLDIAAGTLKKTQPDAEQAVGAIEQARSALEQRLGTLPGVIIERKRLSVGVHFRQVQDSAVVQQVQSVVEQVTAETGLRRRKGKKVFELEPNVEWDKGRALNWLLDALPMLSATDTFIVYIGDDETDEDAFAKLDGRGVGIRVGDSIADSLADYCVADQQEVISVLKRLTVR